MYRHRGLGTSAFVPPQCLSFWQWPLTPECWSKDIPAWQAQQTMLSTQPVGGAPAPTQAQLDAVASGQMTSDQLVTQLAAAQGQSQQAIMAAQVQPVSDFYTGINSLLPGGGPGGGGGGPSLCSQTIMPPMCDSTLYWVGGGLAILVLLIIR